MNTGKKVGGILLIVFGSMFAFMGILFGLIFGLVGGTISGAADEASDAVDEFAKTAIETTGEVVEADDVTVIEYEADGYYYQVQYNLVSSELYEGKVVTVYYDEDTPSECMVPDLDGGVIGMMGGVFSGVGIGMGIFFIVVALALMIPGIILVKKSKVVPAQY